MEIIKYYYNKGNVSKKRGQSTLEYCVIFAVIVAGLIAMNVYMKRAVQGNFRQLATQMSAGGFYEPGNTNGSSMVHRVVQENSNSTTEGEADSAVTNSTTDTTSLQVQNRTECVGDCPGKAPDVTPNGEE